MHPDDEVLAALALGEEVPGDVTAHLAHCQSCRAVLADLRRILLQVRSSENVELHEPPASVWAAITAATSADAGSSAVPDDEHPAAPVRQVEPPPAATAPPVGERLDELAERRTEEKRRPRARWLIAATAAGVALGVLGVQIVGALRAPAPTPVVASAQLDTLTNPRRGGDATLVEQPGGLSLKLSVEPLDAKNGYLEVWLINTDLTRMISVGVLPGNGTAASFVVAPGMHAQGYTLVDISREQFDDRPQHSGDSLLRGTLG